MSEIEINEGNCVLDDCDFDIIDAAFLDYLKACSNAGKEYLIMEVARIKLKINKLNDSAKDKQEIEKANANLGEKAEKDLRDDLIKIYGKEYIEENKNDI